MDQFTWQIWVQAIAFVLLFLMMYFVPSFVAWVNRHKQFTAIVVLNIGLGWTTIGWMAALVWACIKTPTKNG